MSNTDLRPKKHLSPKLSGALTTGDVLDNRFRIVDVIGSGAMSLVYTATHLLLDRAMVVKVLTNFGEYEAEAKERFRREGKIVVGLDHPNIVKVTDAGITGNGCPYIVMPFLEGETLKAWMRRTPNENRDLFLVERFIIDICQGLHAAHQKNIIHRDLKPQNIFLHKQCEGDSFDWVPKILDFGVARDLSATKVSRLTLPSQSFGTEGYMSPEQAKGDDPDKRSDIFSVGCILYELLTGKKVSPFEPVPAPHKLNSEIPRDLSNACMKALEPNPDRRYQTASEFADDLCYRSADMPQRTVSRFNPKSPLFLSLVAGLVLLGVSAFLFWRLPPRPDSSETPEIETTAPAAKTKNSAKPPDKKVSNQAPKDVAVSVSEQTNVSAHQSPETAALPIPMHATKSTTAHPSAIGAEKIAASFSPSETAHLDAQLLEAESLLRQKRFLDAEPLLIETVRLRPKEARAWFGLGSVAFQKEAYQTSVYQIEKALKLRENTEWRILLGHAFLANRQKERARGEWNKILKSTDLSPTIRESVEKLILDLGEDIE